MTLETSDKITIQLFVGCQISSEMRMHLNQSIQWKHAKILTSSTATKLQEIHYQDKDYFGFYIQLRKTTLKELMEFQDYLKQQLQYFCPKLDLENLKICIFPQVFVA